jgi:hypothetical protein
MEACVAAARFGVPLPPELANRDLKWVLTVCETAIETESVANAYICMSLPEQLEFPLDGVSDFTLATLSGILMEREASGCAEVMNEKSDDMLLAILNSETASPMVDYVWIFEDMVQYHVVDSREIDPVETLKRAAAHLFKVGDLTNVSRSRDERVLSILSHMAGVHMELEEYAEAVRIYCELVRYDPGRFETLQSLAEDLAHICCFKAATEVGRRLLRLASKSGRSRQMCPETAALMGLWTGLAKDGREDPLSDHVLSLLNETLPVQSPGSRDMVYLVRAVIPDIDDIPVKRPQV